ncbi:MAG: sigma-70 family RNA polymerase sigma factor, partial [Archangium sp.]|nr:sigma-70 family RNA polymerase sigma factor [Archangium sp.]
DGLSSGVRALTEAETTDVVVRAQRGDREAIERLVRRFLRPAYLVALSVVKAPADAEDVAQEAVAMAMQQLQTCREPSRFSAWLMTNVRNRCLNRIESQRVRQRYADSASREESAANDAERIVLREQLVAALGALSEQQREVVLLHDLESWTHPEIGAALGLSEVNCRQILSVARRALRERLTALEGAPS